MNFQATNLDGAYLTLKNLNNLATEVGENIVTNLTRLIGDLKSHWVGSDATIHINNLINVYTGIATIVQNVHSVAHSTSKPIVNAQTIRNANGGSGEVGTVIAEDTSAIESIDTLGDTTAYFVDITAAPQDLATLIELKTKFDNFCTQFTAIKEDLLNNWLSGSDRPKAVSDFEQFEVQASNFKTIFSAAEENLSKVIANLKQL